MERSYGFLSNFFQNKHFLQRILDIYIIKGLFKKEKLPFSMPRILRLQIYQISGKILPYIMPIISRLRKSPDLWQNITLQYAHDFKAGFVTKFMAKYYPIVCPEFQG